MNLTITRCASYVSGVASFAKTPEGAHGVNALPIPAKVCQDLTFINICTEIIKYTLLYILNMSHLSFDFYFFSSLPFLQSSLSSCFWQELSPSLKRDLNAKPNIFQISLLLFASTPPCCFTGYSVLLNPNTNKRIFLQLLPPASRNTY